MQIAHEPYKKLSFRSYLEYDTPEELLDTMLMSVPPDLTARVALRWANGVLLAVGQFQQSDIVSKEFMEGHLIWDHIDFALMPQYRRTLVLAERPLIVINVLDLSQHSIYAPLAEWLKENLSTKSVKPTKPKPQLARR